MTRTRSFRPQAAAHRSTHGAWRRAAMGSTAAALALSLVACAAPGAPSGTPSDTSSDSATGFSAQWTAQAKALAANWAPDPSAPDVTTAALTSSTQVAALSAAVAGWASPCGATSAVETLVAASRASLKKGHLRAARGLLHVADEELRLKEKQGLVSAEHADWFHHQVTGLVAGIPSTGRVTSTTGFPVVPAVLRCSGQSSSSAPKLAAPSLMLAASTGDATFNVPSVMDTIHVLMASEFELAALGPEGAAADIAVIVVTGLMDLFWPSDQPNYVTWEAMSEYVDSKIKQVTTKITSIIDTDRLAQLRQDLTALATAMDRYDQDMNNLVASPTSFGGYTDASRNRAYSDWLTLDNDFTNLIPHFKDGTESYMNLSETINLYSLYLASLRSWVLSPDKFSENAATSATFEAERQTELTKALTAANDVVKTQLPQLQAAYKVQSTSPMAQGWNKTWGFNDILYQAGYNQVYLWKYMDPIAFPPDVKTGKTTIPADNTVVATPCLGGYSVPDGNGGFVAADPASVLEPLRTSATAGPTGRVPLRNLKLTGDQFGVTGVEEYWGTAVKQTTGTPMNLGLHHVVAFNTAPWTWALSANVLSSEERVDSVGSPSYGGFDELQLGLTTDVTSKTPAITQTPWMVGSNGLGVDQEMAYSFPGYTLAWVAMAGQRRTTQSASTYDSDGGGNSQCMTLGFRLIDTYDTANPYPSGS